MVKTVRQFVGGEFGDDIFDAAFYNAAENDVVIEPTPVSSTQLRVVNADDPSRITLILGSGLAVSGSPGNERPTGGTISTLRFFQNSTELGRIDGLSWGLVAFSNALDADAAGNDGPLDALVDSQAINFIGAAATGAVEFEGAGFGDTLTGSAFDDELDGDEGNDLLRGGAGNDQFVGGRGADRFEGGDGYDYINFGEDENEGGTRGVFVNFATGVIIDPFGATDSATDVEEAQGTDRNDVFIGGGEDNYFVGRGGADRYDGGAGDFDQVAYHFEGGPRGVVIDLAAGTGTDSFGNAETFANIEVVRGTPLADRITGGDERNTFRGLAGNDTMDGGGGDRDEVRYDLDARYGGEAGVRVNLTTGVAVDGFGDRDVISNFERVRGTRFDDVLIGNDAHNTFRGGEGDDAFDGQGSRNYVEYGFSGGFRGIFVNLTSGVAVDSFGDRDTLANIDEISGTEFDDVIIGNADDNWFEGRAGADRYDGLGGDFDTVSYMYDDGARRGLFANLVAGQILDAYGDTDTVANVENVRGTAFADRFIGDAAENRFFGVAGDDTLEGGEGNDWARYDRDEQVGGNRGVVVGLANGVARDGFGNFDTLVSIERATGTRFADRFIGSDGDNVFRGGDGADLFDGRGGMDYVIFNFDGERQGVVVNLTTGVAIDGFGNRDRLTSIEGVLGSDFDDRITGSDGEDEFEGYAGNDLFNGLGGVDTVFYSTEEGGAGVTVDLAARTATDRHGDTDTLVSIENVIGTDLADTLLGDARVNTLEGLGGADVLNGRGGFDYASYENAESGGGARLDGLANWGMAVGDSFVGIEGLIGSDFRDVLVGSAGGNVLRGGAGNDRLFGLDGNDLLEGGEGADQFNGGAGTDTATYAGSATGGGARLDGSANWGMAAGDSFAGVENLIGSAFADTLIGNAGTNRLEGGSGVDNLYGLGGADRFAFAGPGFGTDIIRDFEDGTDLIDFSIYAAVGGIENLAIAQAGPNVRIGVGGDTIFVIGVDIGNLTAADFDFG